VTLKEQAMSMSRTPSATGHGPDEHTTITLVAPAGDDIPTLARQAAARRASISRARRQARAEQRLVHVRAARLRDPDLAHPDAARLQLLYEAVAARVDSDIAAGARVHHRLPWWLRLVPAATTTLDGLVLYAFFATLFGVHLAVPTTARGFVAASFAVLGSAVTYLCLSLAGRALRGYRNPMGEVSWRALGGTTRALVAAAVAVSLALGTLMYARIAVEGASSDYLPAGLVELVAVVFAVFSVVGNLATSVVHAIDGSAETALMRHVGRLLLRWERRCRRAERACGTASVAAAPVPAPEPITGQPVEDEPVLAEATVGDPGRVGG
jgi:hypothetical protein